MPGAVDPLFAFATPPLQRVQEVRWCGIIVIIVCGMSS